MTAAITRQTTRAEQGQSNTARLLAELKTTAQAVQNHYWSSTDLAGTGTTAGTTTGTAPNAHGSTASPLSALLTAGFGWVTQFVSFLEEPLTLLMGDPSSVSSSSQSLQGAGANVSSLASSYQQASGEQTTSWSGSAASGYQNAATQLTNGISALGQANTAMSSAVSGAGATVAQTIQTVTELISQAVGQIIPIVTQAVAAAQVTFGASIAAAIPQVVQIAVQYGQQIAQKMQALLSSAQNLMQLVQSVVQAVAAVTQELTKIGANSTADASTDAQGAGPVGSSASDSTNSTSSGANQQSTVVSADAPVDTSQTRQAPTTDGAPSAQANTDNLVVTIRESGGSPEGGDNWDDTVSRPVRDINQGR